MPVWEFTLIVEGNDVSTQVVHDALYEAGCSDALIGQTNGVQYLDFDRQAPSLEDAVSSAVTDIERVPGMEVVRFVDTDLLSMSEIAERMDRTRESVRLLVTGERGPGGFPPPATDPRRPHRLWRWSDVDRWFAAYLNDQYREGRSEASAIRKAISAGIELHAATRQLGERQRERVFTIARRT